MHHSHQQEKMRFCSRYGKYKLPCYFSWKAVFTKSSKITMPPLNKKKEKKQKQQQKKLYKAYTLAIC